MRKGKIDGVFIHASSEVSHLATISNGTKIWRFSHVDDFAVIGFNCLIGNNCYIGPGVKIGNNVRIHNSVNIYRGITIEDNCFISTGVVFTNLKYPKIGKPAIYQETLVRRGVTIGSNSTIICGVTIGENSFIGAGSVITKDIPNNSLIYGNPAKVIKTLSPDFEEFNK